MCNVLTGKSPQVFVDGVLLFYDAMQSCMWLQTFRRNCLLHLQGKSESFTQEEGIYWEWVESE
jgi:hypothetical protein